MIAAMLSAIDFPTLATICPETILLIVVDNVFLVFVMCCTCGREEWASLVCKEEVRSSAFAKLRE